MKRNLASIIIGVLFLVAGVAIGGNMLGFFEFSFNPAGWWTIFIIIPALYSMAQCGLNTGNGIILITGIILLLNAQEIIPVTISWQLILPVVLLFIGFQLLFSRGSGHKQQNDTASGHKHGPFKKGENNATAFFSGQDIHFGADEFTGASYSATFGGITADLSSAILTRDVEITVSVLFGGIDIILPENIKVSTQVIPILGGFECKYRSSKDPEAHTVHINGNATFGGVTII